MDKKFTALMFAVTVFAVLALGATEGYEDGRLYRFSSYSALKNFLTLKTQRFRDTYGYGIVPAERLVPEGVTSHASEPSLNALKYSKTNVQVEGVDEADIVKTDGEYIYVISGDEVIIVKAYPPEQASIVSRIPFNATLKQIFINENLLVVFYGNCSWPRTQSFIAVFDVSDKKNPVPRMEAVGVDGSYLSSRMIGDYVYMVATKPAYVENDGVSLPKIYHHGVWETVSAREIYYFNIADYAYTFTTIVALNIREERRLTYEVYLLGMGTKMYVSLANIYLANRGNDKTFLARIRMENGEISLAAQGGVQGTVLNQFSMDEHNGYFRIATTSNAHFMPSNNLYVLDMNLNVVGSLENIAPRETIHSARFMGDVCYLVTFRKVDPFFVIDLSDPKRPEILGELKIPGYSDYLHPYDENHVIGVGKETVPAEEGSFSWHQGVKISLFDVANPCEPKELAKYVIGDRGSDSPVLRDHKAFLFDREKELLVIPVLVTKANEDVPPYVYGERVWQGVYVFTVSATAEEKISLKGMITHIENGDVTNSSYYIQRALYIDDVLYTISNSKIKMNALSDMSEIAEVNLTRAG